MLATKRAVMTLFSDMLDANSHRVRLVLAEKGITLDIRDIEAEGFPEDMHGYNPRQKIPMLIDRELVVYEPRIVSEYLDERFPHPPLMPVDPVMRSIYRLYLHRIEEELYEPLKILDGHGEKKPSQAKQNQARKKLRDSLIADSDMFAEKPYFLSDEFSLVDCALAPILWRLPHYGISLPPEADAVVEYAERLFARDAFHASLTETELEIRSL